METITNRIDKVTHIPKQYLKQAPPSPRSVKIELTGKCNYRCGFCALRTREVQPTDTMDLDLFKRITKEMREAGVEEIGVFYLGESLTAPLLTIQAVAYLKQELGMPYVFLTTNGSLASRPVLERLMAAGLDSLKFSVNACDEAQFEEVMGVNRKYFRRSIDNIATAYDVRETGGFSTKLYASSIQYDGEQKTRMQALIDRDVAPFVDQHYWLPLYSMGSVATQREAELGYTPTAGNQGRIGGLVAPLPCWSAFTEGHVRADGTFSLCCFDADGRFTVGDLNTHSFMDVWHSEAFQHVRAAHLRGTVEGTVCEDCIAYQ